MGDGMRLDLFGRIIDIAKVVLSTVPMTNARDEYDMHDVSYCLRDPVFCLQLVAVVSEGLEGRGELTKDTEDEIIDGAIRMFAAGMFSRAQKGKTIDDAKYRIKKITGEEIK